MNQIRPQVDERVGVCGDVAAAMKVGERPGACVGRGVGAGGYKPNLSSFFC